MINLHQAEIIAAKYLQEMQDPLESPLKIVERLDKSFGWVFFYQSQRYLETRDFSQILAGNAPFIVDIADGSLHVFGTAHPVEVYLQEYERGRGKPKPET